MTDIEQMTPEQIRECAVAYLDLLGLMTDALNECETGYGFFWWNGRGFQITGHPPHDLIEKVIAHD